MTANEFLLLAALTAVIALLVAVLRRNSRSREKAEREYAESLALVLRQRRELEERYSDIIEIDEAVEARRGQAREWDTKIARLRTDYASKRAIFQKLQGELQIVEETLDFASFGLYSPHFDFDTSEAYKEKIGEVRQVQKEMIRNKSAAACNQEWTVGDSRREGKKMEGRHIRLMLRAFNNECDSAIAKTTWKNATQMEQRIEKAYEAVNKLSETLKITISRAYLDAKRDELHLAHEHQEKRQAEKEEQRRIREQMREEEKVRREAEKILREAAKEEQQHRQALEQARKELEQAHGEEATHLQKQIQALREQLSEAERMKDRAVSQAELTNRGHVYVISNIGSFGPNVHKIGLTRRLEPFVRVRELGDASVPFAFDVHAMVFSEDAPALEQALQRAFDQTRVNMVNPRKEFFAVSLSDIAAKTKELGFDIEFTLAAEAKEYHESVALREKLADTHEEARDAPLDGFPVEI